MNSQETMEKGKSIRGLPAVPKSLSTARKDKFVPRIKGSRKTENGSNSSAEAKFQRVLVSRPTTFDRRPRQREPGVSRNNEAGSDYMKGACSKLSGKNKSFNHLLNFTLAPRNHEVQFESPPIVNNNYKRKAKTNTNFKYNKEQFLQANCQFVVKDGFYHTKDPDVLVEWENIEQIRMFSNEVSSCPICLYPPVAAKITRCGHIYCWRCILHYLSLAEEDNNSWKRCPICFEAVTKFDLKSVRVLETECYKVGNVLTLQLMKRTKGSTLIYPVNHRTSNDDKLALFDESNTYAKMLVAKPSDVQRDIIDFERTALETQMQDLGHDSLEGSFVKAALKLLKEREIQNHSLREIDECMPLSPAAETETDFNEKLSPISPPHNFVSYNCAFADDVPRSDSGRSTSESSIEENIKPVEEAVADRGDRDAAANCRILSDDENIYFYQASDGQHIYLNSLNARCLVHEYGSLKNSPPLISALVVATDCFTMSQEMRGRMRYLNHLPLTCEFTVAELAFQPPLVSQQTLECFADQFEQRRQQRAKRNRDEKRQLRRMQQKQMRRYEADPVMRQLVSSPQFPEESSHIVRSAMPELLESDQASALPASSPPIEGPDVSFAQMLRSGKVQAKAAAWPTLDAKTPGDCASDEDGCAAPTYMASFSDALKAALDKYDETAQPVAVDLLPPSRVASGNKKKKGKKTLLFTTSVARSK